MTVSFPVTFKHAKDIHPELDVPPLHELVRPDRARWSAGELAGLTSRVAAEFTPALLSAVRFDAGQRWWTRLALTMGMELWLLSWLPGQGTDPHDHGGASGSFTMLLGELNENYRFPKQSVRTTAVRAGATVSFGPKRAHQLHNAATHPAASVHAYSPPLRPLRIYRSLSEYSVL